MLPRPSSEFKVGAFSMLLTLGLFVAAVRVAEWIIAHPQPQTMIDVLTAARFSILDVLAGCLFIVAAVAATYHLPRY
jgi:hypothetical protein